MISVAQLSSDRGHGVHPLINYSAVAVVHAAVMSGPYPLSMYGEPDTNKIKETFSYYRFKCELQPPLLKNIEPAEMIPARYTLTSLPEKFTHPPSDSEDPSDLSLIHI